MSSNSSEPSKAYRPNVSYWCENNTPELANVYEKHEFANSYLYASHLMYFIHVMGEFDIYNVTEVRGVSVRRLL